MDFLYDESGSAYSFIYNGTQYYYVKNLQGDVMRIVDTSGNVVANYSYDAWGKVTNSGNIIGLYNPIRYRGYYYDTDTGFYYLQSRYYDPAIKRFINADSYVNANGDILGFNMYAYCGNNPIIYADYHGNSATLVIGGVVVTAKAILTWGIPLAIGITAIGLSTNQNNVININPSTENIRINRRMLYYILVYSNIDNVIDKAHEKIENTVKRDSEIKYWTATVRRDYVDIGRPLSFEDAIKEIKTGRNVFTVRKSDAAHLIYTAFNHKGIGPEIDAGKEDTKGYYYHYHENRTNRGHVFFLFFK